jgi:hypothetical protein
VVASPHRAALAGVDAPGHAGAGMNWGEGPPVCSFGSPLRSSIRCDHPGRVFAEHVGQPFLPGGRQTRISSWPPLRLVRLLRHKRVSVGVVPSSGSPSSSKKGACGVVRYIGMDASLPTRFPAVNGSRKLTP